MPAATLRDVALKAGVATSTVSRALRNHRSIPKITCQRLQALAREMGYHPDPLIVALVDRRWGRGGRDVGTIAWITTFSNYAGLRHSIFHETLFEGARARAEALGYLLEVFWLREPGMTERRMSQILLNRGIRGVCIAPLPRGRGHLNLKWENFACATIGYSMMRPNLHRASPHHFQGIVESLRQLRRQGYRQIGVWMHQEENRKVSYSWMAGTLLFQQLHPGTGCHLLVGKHWDQEEFKRWIVKHKIEVVLGSSAVTQSWIKELGLKVASATLSLGWEKDQGLPGLDQKPREIGAAAIDLIVDQIRRNETGIPQTPRVIMVEGEWRSRGQAAPALGD